MPRKLQTPKKYQHVLLVELTGSFPMDAFRYERCFPLQEQDSGEIARSMDLYEPPKKRFVFVSCYGESTKAPWFWNFWKGQSGLRAVVVEEDRVTEIRERIENGDLEWLESNFLYQWRLR
jgi:hypothetical protein